MAKRKIELMHSLFCKAYDEQGKCRKCKDCCHLKKYEYRGKRYYKCVPYGVTSSEASDWRLSYDACGLWGHEEYNGDIPIIKMVSGTKQEEQIDGQMSLFE